MGQDFDGRDALQLINGLAGLSTLLRDRAQSMRRENAVTGVKHAVEVNAYQTGPAIECYLDAEISDGTCRSWLLDVSSEGDGWTINARLAQSSAGGQHTVKEVCAVTIVEFSSFLESLDHAVTNLLAFGMDDLVWHPKVPG